MRRTLALLPLVVACGARDAPGAPPPAAARPALAVLVVVDQLPSWSLDAKAPALSAGLRRVLDAGRWATGEHPTIATSTAPGHALLGTGAPPSVHGILGNDWWRRDLGRALESVRDVDGEVTSRWLRAEGIGDVVTAHGGRAVAVSLKDRGAVLPLGHHGLALYYDDRAARFVSADGSVPAWLDAANAGGAFAPGDDAWTPREPARLAALSGGPDDAPGELGARGLGPRFPHRPAATARPAYAAGATPLGDRWIAELAAAAIRGERLGRRGAPDLLVVSFSSYDLIAHGWGQESWEAWDALLALDRDLAGLLDVLDREVGAGRWSMILTSDHGAAPMVERRRAAGLPAARLPWAHLEDIAEGAARGIAGPGDWIADLRYPTATLSPAARGLPPATRERLLDAVVAALAAMPELAIVRRTDRIAGGCAARPPVDRAVCLALDPVASGEVVFVPAEGTVLHENDEGVATHHGSLAAYDRQVPLVVVAPGVAPGRDPARYSTLRVAPTLAAWLGLPAPAQATEPPLPWPTR
jgi:predicted AlkP superfamily pyrophosphatase or phosphodiesterase